MLLPDGSVETGEKQFNSSLPNGSQVLGIPQSTGGWLLDERDVQPIKPPLQPSPMGKIKVLYSQIEGDERVFYLWGDRTQPKRIGSIPTNQIGEIVDARIHNRGNGDHYIAGIEIIKPDGGHLIKSFGDDSWEYIRSVAPTGYGGDSSKNLGHGFWTEYVSIAIPPLGSTYSSPSQPSVQPINYSLYRGVRADFPANVGFEFSSGNGLIKTIYSGQRAILPGVAKSEFATNDLQPSGAQIGIYSFAASIAVSKDLKSAVYVETSNPNNNENGDTVRYKLKSSATEIVLGGAYPFRGSGGYYPGNLIKNRYFEVVIPSDLATSRWDVDAYKLGANTTKSTINSNVTYKPKAGMIFHHASYHP